MQLLHRLRIPLARHVGLALLGVVGFALVAAGPVGAQTSEGTSTAASTATAPPTATPTPFVVTDEGVEQLLTLLKKHLLPAPARLTLAALLEQQGVDREVLVSLVDRPRHCTDGHGADSDHEKRCLDPASAAQACERALAATTTAGANGEKQRRELREQLAERCAKWLKEDRARALEFCERATSVAVPQQDALRELCARLAKKATATPAVSPAALCQEALTASGERSKKPVERCAKALRENRQLASTICAQLTASSTPTKGARALAEYCRKLAAQATVTSQPRQPKPQSKPSLQIEGTRDEDRKGHGR